MKFRVIGSSRPLRAGRDVGMEVGIDDGSVSAVSADVVAGIEDGMDTGSDSVVGADVVARDANVGWVRACCPAAMFATSSKAAARERRAFRLVLARAASTMFVIDDFLKFAIIRRP